MMRRTVPFVTVDVNDKFTYEQDALDFLAQCPHPIRFISNVGPMRLGKSTNCKLQVLHLFRRAGLSAAELQVIEEKLRRPGALFVSRAGGTSTTRGIQIFRHAFVLPGKAGCYIIADCEGTDGTSPIVVAKLMAILAFVSTALVYHYENFTDKDLGAIASIAAQLRAGGDEIRAATHVVFPTLYLNRRGVTDTLLRSDGLSPSWNALAAAGGPMPAERNAPAVTDFDLRDNRHAPTLDRLAKSIAIPDVLRKYLAGRSAAPSAANRAAVAADVADFWRVHVPALPAAAGVPLSVLLGVLGWTSLTDVLVRFFAAPAAAAGTAAPPANAADPEVTLARFTDFVALWPALRGAATGCLDVVGASAAFGDSLRLFPRVRFMLTRFAYDDEAGALDSDVLPQIDVTQPFGESMARSIEFLIDTAPECPVRPPELVAMLEAILPSLANDAYVSIPFVVTFVQTVQADRVVETFTDGLAAFVVASIDPTLGDGSAQVLATVTALLDAEIARLGAALAAELERLRLRDDVRRTALDGFAARCAITRAGVDFAVEGARVADLERRVAAQEQQHGANAEALALLREELRKANEKLVKAREANERAEAELREQQRQAREAREELQRQKKKSSSCVVQ